MAAAAAASSSSSSSSINLQWKKNDAFISFRGADIRDGFLSHLYEALRRKQIRTFKDDKLERGEEISPALLQTIENSKFSENYAFSPWCLDELVKILECQKTTGQIVLPVFYKVDPSDVQELTGRFGDALSQHKKKFKHRLEKVESWSLALKRTANISGWDSRIIKPETKLIEEIVNDVGKKLNNLFLSVYDEEGFVGIDSRVKKVESLLCLESKDVRMIGIWGMGGIGKTTIADKVFNRIVNKFESQYFAANVREKLEKGTPVHLRDEILCKILGGEDFHVGTPCTLHPFIKNSLQNRRVLFVLDDVDGYLHLEELVGGWNLYGPGSRIIITSRDKQVLEIVKCEKYIYEVEKLNDCESLQLFSLHAFKQTQPTNGYMRQLSERVISYTQGVPLALKVLGCSLYGKVVKEWESELEKLETIPNKEIQGILRRSYDGLDDNEKSIFLDIACFFKGEDKDRVKNILDCCGFFAESGIRNLLDKSLINIFKEKLEMHDLLEQMGKDIVCKENKKPRKHSRLWNAKDIYYVLTTDKEAESVEAISLDLSKIKNMELCPSAFEKFYKLRLLKFYNPCFKEIKLHLPKGLEFLPNELRFLYWDQYPLKSLPSKFCPENLVELHMQSSQLKQLWNEDDLCLEKLIFMDLSNSEQLIKIPDLSKFPKLEVIILRGCMSLVDFSSSSKYHSKIIDLDLRHCEKLCHFPSGIYLTNLVSLSLNGCSELAHLPSSLGELRCLEYLYLKGCKKLASLPNSICNLKSLKCLNIKYCVNLHGLPEKLGELESLENLKATGSGIKELPPSINQLKKLNYLNCDGCEGLILPPFTGLASLRELSLQRCYISEIPSNLGSLESLVYLYLSGNNFRSIPASIEKCSKLNILDLSDCMMLQYLPELPPGLAELDAENCTSVEFVSRSFIQGYMNSCLRMNLSKCINLDKSVCSELILLKLQSMGQPEEQYLNKKANATNFNWKDWLCIPGSEVPEWMMYKNDNGSSLSCFLTAPSPHSHATPFVKILFCALLAPEAANYSRKFMGVISCECRFITESGDSFKAYSRCFLGKIHHISLWYSTIHFNSKKFCIREASFQFYVGLESMRDFTFDVGVHKCGVHLMFDDNLEDDDDDRKRWSAMVFYDRAITEGLFFTPSVEYDHEQYPLQGLKEKQEFKCFDLNFSLSFLFTLVICLATASDQTEAQPTQMVFALMLIHVCLKLLSFNSSLSLHGIYN
ncbi:disease resistance protein RPV1-like [Hevea brasiliensis]|uniref:disease resistance protein RPV1-like n=1 Tax=Hevea brasiliensis TaxID=3981 RepID=UPI0025CC0D2F|nr:disease resistance protein RPV1-like [Hevea brasiliensis]